MKTETNPTFDHNGVTITLETNGKFSAMGPAGRITSGSLDGIKKRLDKDGMFTPFKAFTVRSMYGGIKLESYTVVGFAEPRRKYGAREWKVIDPAGIKQTRAEVYEDTPANRELAAQYIALVKEHHKVREAQENAEVKLLTKIKSRRPEGKK